MSQSNPILIVGLGNPGKAYQHTRHNVGFLTCDLLRDLLLPDYTFTEKKAMKSLLCEGIYLGRKITIAKPQTFMNLSGEAVLNLSKFSAEDTEIWIIHDDIDLDEGIIRASTNASPGTHNGIRSIVSTLGRQNFTRIRIGIFKERHIPLSDFVLSKLTKDELKQFECIIHCAATMIQEHLDRGELPNQTINAYVE